MFCWKVVSVDVVFDLDAGRLIVYQPSCLKVFVRLQIKQSMATIVERDDLVLVPFFASGPV